MSRPVEAGRGGGGRGGGRRTGGRGGRGPNKSNNHVKKIKGHTSSTEEIKFDVFETGKPEHAALYEKSKKAVIAYIRRKGDSESELIASALEDMVIPTIPLPPRAPMIKDPDQLGQVPPVMIQDPDEVLLRSSEMKYIPQRRQNLSKGLKQNYAIIWDQCSLQMRSKLEQINDYNVMDTAKDPVRLLTEMKNIVCGRESHQQPIYSMCQLIKILVSERQHYNESNEDYKERFEGLWEAVNQQGGSLWYQEGMITTRANKIAADAFRLQPNDADLTQAKEELKDEFKACFMLSGGNNTRHHDLKEDLENKYTLTKHNGYPKNTTELLSMMNNYRTRGDSKPSRTPRREVQNEGGDKGDDGINFMQEGGDSNENENNNEGVNMLMNGANTVNPRSGE